MRTFPATVLFRDSCVRCAATSDGSAKLNAGGEEPHFSPGVDRTLCRRSGGKVESTGWGARGGSVARADGISPPNLRQSALLRGCERIPSRRRAADASRRAALLLLAIASGYDSSSRLARRAPRPPGSVRGFIHNLLARQLAQPRARRVHQAGHVPVRVAVLVHELVHVRDLLEGEGLGEARVDLVRRDQVVQGLRLLVVGEVRALEALLPHPEVAQIGDRGVAARAGADDDHAARVADEDRGRHGVLARVLEDDARAPALAHHLPEGGAEGARALQPLAVPLRVLPVLPP